MESVWRDLRYGLRLLRRSPGFTAAAALTLALGMGANTVMFSVLYTVLLRPLPYPHPNQLVQIWETDQRRGEIQQGVASFDFLEWRRTSHQFSEIATYTYNPVVLTGLKEPESINAQSVSAEFFDVLQVRPTLGRTFRPDEDKAGNALSVVLSFGTWSRYFGRDPDIVGKTIDLNDQVFTVVGVMPEDFAFPAENVEAWVLPGFDWQKISRFNHSLLAIGRLRSGVTLNQAQAEIEAISENRNLQDGLSTGVRLVGLRDEIVGDARSRLLMLWTAVFAVLLIACANVAGLLLARALSRQKEIAIRMALGGTRRGLIRQFIVESIFLSGLGGLLGLALSYILGHVIVSKIAYAVPRLREFHVDGAVLGLMAFVCLTTGFVFGIAPGLHAFRFDFQAALKQIASASQLSTRFGPRSMLVVGEFALATVLLVMGGLLMKTLWNLEHVDPGFQTERIISFRLTLPKGRYDSRELAVLYQHALDRLAAIPGVAAVGATNNLPFAGSRTSTSFELDGHPLVPGQMLLSDRRVVSAGFMQAMRIRLVLGREFDSTDGPDTARVCIVNQAFVKTFLPTESPLAQRLKFHDQLFQIIGVTTDVKYESLIAPSEPEIYVLYLQDDPANWTYMVLRSQTNVETLPGAIRNAMREITPNEPIYRLNTMSHLVESSISPNRASALLLAVFAGLGLILAAIGIYGVIAYSVIQRTREFGIRMALGADRADVRTLVLMQGLRIAVLGVVLGTMGAWIATRILSSMFFTVNPHDPIVFLAVPSFLILIATVASFIPARRAMSVDPLAALRYE